MAESGTGDPQAEALSSMMVPMLVLLGMMVLLSINEGIREGLANTAGAVIEPILPYGGEYFVLTVFLVGIAQEQVFTRGPTPSPSHTRHTPAAPRPRGPILGPNAAAAPLGPAARSRVRGANSLAQALDLLANPHRIVDDRRLGDQTRVV